MRITSAETVELRAYMRWVPRAPIVAKKQRSPPRLASIAANCRRERDVSPRPVPLPAETPVPEVGKSHFGEMEKRLSLDQVVGDGAEIW